MCCMRLSTLMLHNKFDAGTQAHHTQYSTRCNIPTCKRRYICHQTPVILASLLVVNKKGKNAHLSPSICAWNSAPMLTLAASTSIWKCPFSFLVRMCIASRNQLCNSRSTPKGQVLQWRQSDTMSEMHMYCLRCTCFVSVEQLCLSAASQHSQHINDGAVHYGVQSSNRHSVLSLDLPRLAQRQSRLQGGN